MPLAHRVAGRGAVLLSWITLLLIAVSVVAGWVAIGRLAAATERGLARTEESLVVAVELAERTAASAAELQRVVGVVGDGLGSTGDSLAATRQVSSNVRGLLDAVSFIGSVDDLVGSLEAAETSLVEVEADLGEAAASVRAADPVLTDTVASLREVPGELRASIAEVRTSRNQVGDQVWLWRTAIVAAGAAMAIVAVRTARP
jgi:hypothetical protein